LLLGCVPESGAQRPPRENVTGFHGQLDLVSF
jgi:hypothetical protein